MRIHQIIIMSSIATMLINAFFCLAVVALYHIVSKSSVTKKYYYDQNDEDSSSSEEEEDRVQHIILGPGCHEVFPNPIPEEDQASGSEEEKPTDETEAHSD